MFVTKLYILSIPDFEKHLVTSITREKANCQVKKAIMEHM